MTIAKEYITSKRHILPELTNIKDVGKPRASDHIINGSNDLRLTGRTSRFSDNDKINLGSDARRTWAFCTRGAITSSSYVTICKE